MPLCDRHAPKVRSVPPPADSAIASWYREADLADAYAVALPGPGPHDLSAVADRALSEPPAWIGAAMTLRDAAMRPFGVRTSGDIKARLEESGRDGIGFFPVLSRSGAEIILGEDDRHLDFRLSLRLTARESGQQDLTAATVVRCHNRLGRAYLAAIRLGHILVVRSLLRKAATRSAAPAGGSVARAPGIVRDRTG